MSEKTFDQSWAELEEQNKNAPNASDEPFEVIWSRLLSRAKNFTSGQTIFYEMVEACKPYGPVQPIVGKVLDHQVVAHMDDRRPVASSVFTLTTSDSGFLNVHSGEENLAVVCKPSVSTLSGSLFIYLQAGPPSDRRRLLLLY